MASVSESDDSAQGGYGTFPVVATIYNGACDGSVTGDDTTRLPDGADILIEGRKVQQFVHIEICAFTDPDRMLREKGAEFVLEHDGFVGQHFIIPLGINTPLKIVNPGGKRKKYTNVRQILEDTPRYIRIDEDTVAMSPEPGGGAQFLESDRVHEIIAIKAGPKVKDRRHVVTHDTNGKVYCLGTNFQMLCTAIQDKNEYKLSNFVANEVILLPKTVEFQNISPYDVVTWEDSAASELLVMLSGPVRIIGVETRQFLVGCIKQTESFITILIPESSWKRMETKLKLKTFETSMEKLKFAQEHFPDSTKSECIETKLYAIKSAADDVTWLQDRHCPNDLDVIATTPMKSADVAKTAPPVPPRKSPHGNKEPPNVPGTKSLHGSNEPPLVSHTRSEHPVAAVTKPSPPVASTKAGNVTKKRAIIAAKIQAAAAINRYAPHGTTRKPTEVATVGNCVRLPTRKRKKVKYGVDDKIKEKLRMGFGKIHTEIQKLFKSDVDKSSIMTGIASDNDDSVEIVHKDRALPSLPKSRYSSLPSTTSTLSKPSKHINDLPTQDRMADKRELMLATRDDLGIAKDDRYYLTNVFDPDTGSDNEVHDYDYPDFALLDLKPAIPLDSGRDESEVDRVYQEGQSCVDFYTYSVKEVVHCFTLCALPSLAEICKCENLDGSFFKSLPAESLCEEPFSLSALQSKKANLAIKEGLRPQ